MNSGDIADLGTAAWLSAPRPSRAGARPREDQPRAVPRTDRARGRQARAGDGHAVDLAGRRAHVGARARGGGAGRGHLSRSTRTHRGRTWRGAGAEGLPRGHRLGCSAAAPERSSSGFPWPPGWGAARPTRPPRCGWPGTPRVSATISCCASWARRWARTCPRRSSPGAGWPAAPASCWRGCRIPTRRRSACSSCPRRPGSRPRRCTRRPIGWGCVRSSEALQERRHALHRALELSAPVPAVERAAGQRSAAGRDLAVPGDRRRARRRRARRERTSRS